MPSSLCGRGEYGPSPSHQVEHILCPPQAAWACGNAMSSEFLQANGMTLGGECRSTNTSQGRWDEITAFERCGVVEGNFWHKFLFRFPAEKEHSVLLACMRHVVKLPRCPRSLEIRYGRQPHYFLRRHMDEHICLRHVP